MAGEFDVKVYKKVEKLKRLPLRAIESEAAGKRVSWFRKHRPAQGHGARPSPRDAFELLFFDYMGLNREDLPVAADSESEIAWRSRNPCSTLDACKRLGLDTRVVCRGAYEKSTQAFVSQLDPSLRFLRSYEEIRPYTSYCAESIVRLDFEEMMAIAIEEAKASKREGNKGYGAVVALGGRIIGRAHDTAITEKDPSLHAEVNAIRQAVRALGDVNLSGAVLFSTCEPCPMCSSLAVWANLTTIIYGASIQETAASGNSRILVSAGEIAEKSPVMLEVIGNVLGEECRLLYG